MHINEKKENIQNDALKAWLDNDKIGTAEIITGLGKTFLALKALQTYPKNTDDVHLFLAEQTDRKKDLIKDIEKFNKIYNCDIFNDYNLQFYCYQTVRKWKNYNLGLVIADEIHDAITVENSKFFFNNKHKGVLGLTAKFNGDRYCDFSENKDMINIFNKLFVPKQEILDIIAPIIYRYTINQGQKDNTSRKLNIFIFNHDLDNIIKNIKAGNKNKPFFQTELARYKYLTNKFQNTLDLEPIPNEDLNDFTNRKNLKILSIVNERVKFLHTLPSRFKLVRELLKYINDKTIIFSNSVDELEKFTPNVVSSRKSDSQNQEIRDLFDKDVINIIGSFKKLKQGANLEKVANCILHSYYSTEIDFIQRIGRLRQDGNKEGNVFIFVANNTQEEVWLNKMLENADSFNIKRMNLSTFIEEKHYKNL